MTFGSAHYVPVLKVKQGEKDALRSIAPRLHTWITPFLEVVEVGEKDGRKKTLHEHIHTTFKGLALPVPHNSSLDTGGGIS